MSGAIHRGRAWLGHGLNAPLLLAGVAIVVYAAFFASLYDMRVLTLAGVYAILVLGYQFVFGHAGALSLAQGAFFGLGAYATGILGSLWGVGFQLTFPFSILVPGVVAALIAAPVLRLESHYFALATLAFSQAVLLLAVNWESVTGGANGLPGVPGVRLFGEGIGAGAPLLLFVWVWVALGAVIARRAMRGLYGQSFAVMRAAPLAAGTLGIDTGMLRYTAFVLSALYAGGAGALYVHTIRVVSPEVLGFGVMVICLTMTVVGGRTTVAGALVGALLLTHLPEWFRALEEYYLIASGGVLLAAVVFAPTGLVGAALALASRPDGRRGEASAPSPGGPVTPTAGVRGEPLLRIVGVGKSYGGVRALDGVDLDIRPGEIVGLIGPNGSGKTTLANLICGLDEPDSGRIAFVGREITGLASHRIARLGIARSFQMPDLPPEMRLVDAVAVGAVAREDASIGEALLGPATASADRARARATALLERFALAEHAVRPCAGLPHGVRRRADVARALATTPRLLILDEPAAGLTEAEATGLARVLRGLAESGPAILVIEHNVDFLMPLADRLLCLDRGALIAAGPPRTVVADPRVAAAYFGDATAVEATA